MSAFSTKYVSREEAERMVLECRQKRERPLASVSDEDLDRELHEYVYSENYTDIVGVLYNYIIKD